MQKIFVDTLSKKSQRLYKHTFWKDTNKAWNEKNIEQISSDWEGRIIKTKFLCLVLMIRDIYLLMESKLQHTDIRH